jgi:hypothetical protein
MPSGGHDDEEQFQGLPVVIQLLADHLLSFQGFPSGKGTEWVILPSFVAAHRRGPFTKRRPCNKAHQATVGNMYNTASKLQV